MRTSKPTLVALFCFLIFATGRVVAASQIIGPPWSPDSTNLIIQTVGGVTYFTHTSDQMPDSCTRIQSGPVLANGTNLTQEIDMVRDTGNVCLDASHADTHVSVLGALPPGAYSYKVISYDPFFLGTDVWAQWNFVVPPSTSTLTASLQTNDLQLSVAGISNVEYVVQGSGNLTNWTAIATNIGGPFLLNTSLSQSNLFLRTLITGH